METFGQRLREFRKALASTRRRLAAHVGLPTTAISKIENGTRDVTLAEAQALARVLHIEAWHFGRRVGGGARKNNSPAGPGLFCREPARYYWSLAAVWRMCSKRACRHHPRGRDEEAYRGQRPRPADRDALLRSPARAPPAPSVLCARTPLLRAWTYKMAIARTRRTTRWSPRCPPGSCPGPRRFLLDISLPLGVVVGIPSCRRSGLGRLRPSGGVRSLASLSAALDLPSSALSGSPPGTPAWFDITNRALALGTLWATMFLVRRSQRGEVALRQPHANGYAPL